MPSKLKITKVRFPGALKDERVIIRAVEDAEVGLYALLKAPARDGSYFGGNCENAYWFPDASVKAGDLVVLYTRTGTQSKKVNENGSTSHFFYWDLSSAIWSPNSSAAVIIEAKDWSSMIVPEV